VKRITPQKRKRNRRVCVMIKKEKTKQQSKEIKQETPSNTFSLLKDLKELINDKEEYRP
jgi:nicotinic acid mononucleotide adenylyltransferase